MNDTIVRATFGSPCSFKSRRIFDFKGELKTKSSTMGRLWFSQLEGAHRCNGKSLFCQKNEQNVLRRAIKCQVWSCGACKTSCVYSHNHPLWHASLTDLETLENAANAVLFPEHMPRALFWVSDLFFAADSSYYAQTYLEYGIYSRLNMLVIW